MDTESANKFTEDVLNQPEQETGDVTAASVGVDPGAADGPARPREEPLKVTLKRRLERDGRWSEVEPIRDEMMRDCRKQGMSKVEAQDWTYAELDRLYPPLPPPPEEVLPTDNTSGPSPAPSPITQRVQGLQDIPADWPDLPGNASLQAEIGWVQAERLRIVEETASGATVVHLARARSPAPSMAALGWLETSIRSYAKFIDVAAKATTQQQDEAELVRRERVSIDEMRQLLGEMVGAEVCPTCGRAM